MALAATRRAQKDAKAPPDTLAPRGVSGDFSARLRAVQGSLRARLERRDALIDMMRVVNATTDPAVAAASFLDRLSSWVPAPSLAVAFVEASNQLTILAEHGVPAENAVVASIAAAAIKGGEPFLTADLRRDPRVVDGQGTAVALPLNCRGRAVGALVTLDPCTSAREPRLTAGTARALAELLEPVAVALDGMLQLQRAEALSVTDDLTQLYNLRYLNQVLRREVKRSSRNGRPLSLLFIDLDGFKSVNDAHGHLSGSRALIEAASVIRHSARETDVVARYGGDEFALVLPDTGAAGALAVGERIRERLSAHRFLVEHGLDVHLTASVGIATLPDVAESPEALMRAADAAMYRVKDRGKNGIEAARGPATSISPAATIDG